MKRIPYIKMDGNSSIDQALPDGFFMVVRFNDDKVATKFKTQIDQTFPWRAKIFQFSDGMCEQVGAGSSPANLTSKYEISKIYLVDLADEKVEEMTRSFADVGIELVPEVHTTET